jgi:hypothetical protein
VVEFLSHEWFAVANRAFDDVAVASSYHGRLQYATRRGSGTVIRWSQVIADGAVSWLREALAYPDVEVASSELDAFCVLGRSINGNAATAATTMTELRPDGRYVGPPPPLDFALRPELGELPCVLGASLCVACEHTSGPFGTTHYTLVFEDGRFVDMELGVLPEADAALSFSFRQLMLFRRGEITMLDALEDGRVAGSQGALGLLAGLVESSAYLRAQAATAAGPAPNALIALGEASEQESYRHAMDAVLADTAVPS